MKTTVISQDINTGGGWRGGGGAQKVKCNTKSSSTRGLSRPLPRGVNSWLRLSSFSDGSFPLTICLLLLLDYSSLLCWVTQSCLTLGDPMDCSPPGSTGDSPGKKAGVGCQSLLQEIFPTQGLNPGLPHCRRILLDGIEQFLPLKDKEISAVILTSVCCCLLPPKRVGFTSQTLRSVYLNSNPTSATFCWMTLDKLLNLSVFWVPYR